MSPASPDTTPVDVDVLIVGAGISGIGAAYYLQREHPRRSYIILEARDASGGTWDLFRYPGIRSDSDLHTFGYELSRGARRIRSRAPTRSSRMCARPRPSTASTARSGSSQRWSACRGRLGTPVGRSRSIAPTRASERR